MSLRLFGYCFALMFFAGTAAAAEHISPWEKFEGWKWGDDRPAEIFLPPLTTYGARTAENADVQFGAKVNGGWTDDGLVFFVDVTDSCVENNHPDHLLWQGDAVEFFITSPNSNNYGVGNRLQVVVAPPDENGSCRAAFYAANTESAEKNCLITGSLIDGGYTVILFVPWEALGGNAEEMIMQDGFLFNMFFDDYLKAIKSLNGRIDIPKSKNASMLMQPVSGFDSDTVYDITSRLPPFAHNTIAPMDSSFEINVKSAEKITVTPGTNTVVDLFSQKDGITFWNGAIEVFHFDGRTIQQAITAPANPGDRVMALGVMNALDCIKSTAVSDEYPDELLWRMRQLQGEDISGAPGVLSYLNLMGDPSGLAQVGIARNKERAVLTVQWGGIPIVYADINIYASAEAARKSIADKSLMRTAIDLDVPGADAVYAGHGLTFSTDLVTDADAEYLVSFIDPAIPSAIVRIQPEKLLQYTTPAAYVVTGGANPEHIAIMKEAGIPEMSAAEAAKANVPLVYIGREGFDVDRKGQSYLGIKYGIDDDIMWAVKDNVAVQTSCTVPEIAIEVAAAIFECKPISAETIDRWRRLRLESMGGDIPELRELGRLVRTGDVHTHTFFSDGLSTPGTLLAEAIAGGMEFLIITDHESVEGAKQLTAAMQKSQLYYPLIWGSEVTANEAYHLNVFPLHKPFDRCEMSFGEIIASAREQGAVVMLNHPMSYGVNLRHYWYNSMENSGIDVVERELTQRETWRKNGYEAAFLGSTDTHSGIFGHGERSVFLMDEVTGEAIAHAVQQGKCAMLAPNLPLMVYGSEEAVKAVRAALGDDTLPEYHNKRMDELFSSFDAIEYLKNVPSCEQTNWGGYGWAGNPEEVITDIPDRE